MNYNQEIESFIRDFVKYLNEDAASLFIGAGMSVPAGFVNWSQLLEEIATDLGLNVNVENDLISVAQFHVNENMNRSKLNQKILEEFTEDTAETQNHKLIAKMPLASIWTTNYDNLIEKAFANDNKIVDVKYTIDQLLLIKHKRDIVLYKMHGDASHPNNAIITKEQYEEYHQTHEPFINALAGELTTKTFLFLGFSFTDPNLDYVLSRLNYRFKNNKRQHYCLIKKPEIGDPNITNQAALDYYLTKHRLKIGDLKRYGIKAIEIESYTVITEILTEIDLRFKKQTIFISGSAETYEPFSKSDAIGFVHTLSYRIIKENFRIVNGFGWGIGSSVINGALEAIYVNPMKFSETQLILKPFPQFKSGNKELKELWTEYRNKMIDKCGVAVFVFGNKLNDKNEIVLANGMKEEFEIAKAKGVKIIPIALTEWVAKQLWQEVMNDFETYYENLDELKSDFETLGMGNELNKNVIDTIIKIINLLNK